MSNSPTKSSSMGSSPYGAPNTPIASAKRNVRTAYNSAEESEKEISKTESVPLFSPALKYDDESSQIAEEKVQLESTHAVSAKESTQDEEAEDVFNPYLFIASLPSHSSVRDATKICLPPPTLTPQFTLVLDLDETLVHCTVDPIENPDLVFPVNFNGTLYQVHVRKRPYLDYFLESVCKNYEVVVFTASQSIYANALLDLVFFIFPLSSFLTHLN